MHEVPAQVLEWRQLTKLKSPMPTRWSRRSTATTGRVHTSFALAATATGRFSSNNPNLQNIPIRTEEGRKIRRAFVAEPGHLLLSADYSQIELRLAAHVAEIAELKQAFRDGRRHSRADREPGVRRAARRDGRQHAAPRQGDQFRHHLRHQRLWPRQRRSACRRARRRTTSAPISTASRHPRLYGADQDRVPRAPAMSRRSSAANATSPASATPTRRAAPAPSGRRSTRRCRARPPTSSSARWSASPPRWRSAKLQAAHAAAGP